MYNLLRFILFYLNVHVFSHVCFPHVCEYCGGQIKVSDPLELELHAIAYYLSWELISDTLEEQQVLLTAVIFP